ncbi:MAG: hypothetical protein AVDCRST_MAG18-4373 [uncultured Thermomicrobiales bacterium]|uniref:Uncharacterized protein n=1 Tax=uncultured Thermomicrobiales bacterium TaxID=1645740 RepID=A0A6J4VU93_9BACT|nr:MAG: hypothetical protein AVDCRST_MAG18-4373 [uncultured Thermomicrobiales bacterium]
MSDKDRTDEAARFAADPRTDGGKAPGATGRDTDHNLAQQSGSLTGQGDAVDTEESAGIIDETAGTTAGRRVDGREPKREG